MMLNRRRFLGLGGTKPRATSSSAAPCSFSLEQFYERRGPQASPPVVIRPTSLFYDVETTDVGSGNVRDAESSSEGLEEHFNAAAGARLSGQRPNDE